MTSRRRAGALAVALCLVAGCSGGDEEPDRKAMLDDAFDATFEAGTAGLGFLFRIENLPPELGDVSVAGEGQTSLSGNGATLKLNVSEGLAEFSGATPGRIDLVDDGAEAFIRLGTDGAALWRPIDDGARRPDEGGFDLLAGTDPSAGLAFVAEAAVAADVEVEDLVRERPATRYEVTLEPERVSASGRGRGIADQLLALGFEQVFAYVWLDDAGRVVRVRYDADLARLEGGGPFGAGGRFVTEFELFDFGAPLQVELPPSPERASEPVDQAELQLLLGGLGI